MKIKGHILKRLATEEKKNEYTIVKGKKTMQMAVEYIKKNNNNND